MPTTSVPASAGICRVERMELSYIRARQVFDKDERRIMNATKGGMLEVFERVDYDELIAEMRAEKA